MLPPRDFKPEQLREWADSLRAALASDLEAAQWLDLWLAASNMLDDLVDRDVPDPPTLFDYSRSLLLLTAHPFWLKHEGALLPLTLTILALYEQSLDGDKEHELSTWMLAELGFVMQFMVVTLARGYPATRKLAADFHALLREATVEPKPNRRKPDDKETA